MRTFTAEQISRYREIIKDLYEAMDTQEGNIVYKEEPEAVTVSWLNPTAWFGTKRTNDTIVQTYRHESLNRRLDNNPFEGNYHLSRFLREIYNLGTLADRKQLKNIPQGNDNAIVFFLQAEAHSDKSNQKEVNENCRAKLQLIMEGKISWNDINHISDKDHPLLNPAAIARMAEESSTLAEEMEKVELRSAIKELLGEILLKCLTIEFNRLAKLNNTNPTLSNANNKASKFSTWLNTAQKLFVERRRQGKSVPEDLFEFLAFDVVINVGIDKVKNKNLKKLLMQKRNPKDSSMPASYIRIIDELIPFLRHLKTLAERDDEAVQLLRELKNGLEPKNESLQEEDTFEPTFQALQNLVSVLKPHVFWHEVKELITDYYSTKSLISSSFFSGNSPIVKSISNIISTKDLSQPVSNKEKEDITIMMWRHATKINFNVKAKKISLSGVMMANLLRLFYNPQGNNHELLAILKSFSSEQDVRDYVKQHVRSTLAEALRNLHIDGEYLPPSDSGEMVLSTIGVVPDTLETVGVELEELKLELITALANEEAKDNASAFQPR